ncbi:larval cuticle protein A2B-like [Uranotaenia lowii]|uniref:larval cuticle protein A2B-like n=1 Tax=Uranotaenia lowii TaxID=190385 RepID=UPI00247846D5|nr:larval cuticle protein A2B-like [Uranotaenia lowii]
MAFKFVALCALMAVAHAAIISSPSLSYTASAPQANSAPLTKTFASAALQKKIITDEYDSNAQYEFSYQVSDLKTGDQKFQQESRNGDIVKGVYWLVEPDGTKRTVEYTADSIQGFNAIVNREPLKTVVAQPAFASYSAPLSKTILSQPALLSKSTTGSYAYSN